MNRLVGSDVEVAVDSPGDVSGPQPPHDGIVVTRGGAPDDDVLVAIAVAITAAAEHDAATAVRRTDADVGPPAWVRASLIEGTGGPTMAAPTDLDAGSTF